jgi:hypothetical protein
MLPSMETSNGFLVRDMEVHHNDRLLKDGWVNVVLLQSSTPHMIGMHPIKGAHVLCISVEQTHV